MLTDLKNWLKTSPSPWARRLFMVAKRVRRLEFPSIRPLHLPLYHLHVTLRTIWAELTRALYWTPLFRARTQSCGRDLYLYTGMPQVVGSNLKITIGNDVRMSGQLTISGRAQTDAPELIIGNNVDVGWLTGFSVGTRIVLEDDVRLAGRHSLFGFSGHPMNAEARALGLPDPDDRVGDIILERGVWLGTGVVVTAGVRIGAGTVVGANSVVTKDLPAGVIAGGIPAQVIRPLPDDVPEETLVAARLAALEGRT